MISADVAVVGGGMAGVSVAAALAPSARVVLLEREAELGFHATARSVAQFQESNGPAPVRALTKASRPHFEAIGAEAAGPALRPRRTLWIAQATDRAKLEALVAAEDAVERVSPARARELCPALRAEYATAAAVEDRSKDIDVDLVFQHYLRTARRAGARIVRSAEVLAGRWDGSSWRLSTAAGEVAAAVIVDAAGAWADEIARTLGARPVGLRALRRTAVVCRVSPGRADPGWPLVADIADRFYFRPEAEGVLASPADETPSTPADARPDPLDVARTLERINAATDLDVRSVARAWAGLRTFAADRLPVVGFDPDVPGLCWLAGQGGFGIQLAPALAQLAAHLVTGTPLRDLAEPGLDADALAPDRFGARPAVNG